LPSSSASGALRHVNVTIAALALLLGIFWIVNGAAELFTAIGHREMPGRGWTIILSLLSIVAGIVVLAYPDISLLPPSYWASARRARRHRDRPGVPTCLLGGLPDRRTGKRRLRYIAPASRRLEQSALIAASGTDGVRLAQRGRDHWWRCHGAAP
jgi:hypothetical protein